LGNFRAKFKDHPGTANDCHRFSLSL
jgi:hypothetical protein